MTGTWPAGTGMPGNVTFYTACNPQARCCQGRRPSSLTGDVLGRCWERAPLGRERDGNMTGTWLAVTGTPGNVTFYSVPQARCRGHPTLIAGVSLGRPWEGTVLGT